MTIWKARTAPVSPLLLMLAAILALMLALPGQTVTTAYLNDLIIFLDGAHRIDSGQVPSRDFHTALGPLAFYLPAFGYWLSGSLGGAMPTGMALLTLALAPIIVHVLNSRLRPVIALPYGSLLLLILAVPMNLGETFASLSFAMFYNRIGWVALSALLVMYLQPERIRKHQDTLDALCAFSLTVVMLYTKVTYGAVALVFLAFMIFDPRQRRWAILAMLSTAAAGLAVEMIWQSSMAHLSDLILTSRVSGTRSLMDYALGFTRHLADYVILAILAVPVLWRTRSFRDLMFFGICAGPGLMLYIQNSQPWGIITIHAGAAVAAEMLLRFRQKHSMGDRPLSAAPLLLLALVLPVALQCCMSLGLHTVLAATGSGQAFGLPRFDRIKLARHGSEGDRNLAAAYLESIRDGTRILTDLPTEPKRVSVLDFANPFSASLGLPPPRGDSAWLHWGRNINASHFIPPEQLFRDVEILMAPKRGINSGPLRELYGSYIRTAFEPIHETEAWIVYRHRARPMQSGTAASNSSAYLSRVGFGDEPQGSRMAARLSEA